MLGAATSKPTADTRKSGGERATDSPPDRRMGLALAGPRRPVLSRQTGQDQAIDGTDPTQPIGIVSRLQTTMRPQRTGNIRCSYDVPGHITYGFAGSAFGSRG